MPTHDHITTWFKRIHYSSLSLVVPFMITRKCDFLIFLTPELTHQHIFINVFNKNEFFPTNLDFFLPNWFLFYIKCGVVYFDIGAIVSGHADVLFIATFQRRCSVVSVLDMNVDILFRFFISFFSFVNTIVDVFVSIFFLTQN